MDVRGERMKRILFVDDEPQLLDGLRDLLSKQRRQWDMVFALGGQAALVECARAPFDVVVSDIRMPGMDGVALLTQIKQRYPATARIVLSGHAERDATVKALPVAHQFLSKPCEADTLRTVVDRACRLQRLLHDDAVRRVVGRLDRLPSVPRTYWELTQAAATADVGMADLGKIVEKDAAMTVKVLQLVNSSYFGLPRKQASVRQAVAYLGIELLKSLVLSAHVFATATPKIEAFSMNRLQEESVLTARIAKRILGDHESAMEAYTAALVHEVGQIVLAISIPERFGDAIRASESHGRALHLVEHDLLGVTHAEVGAYLLGLWGLPLSIVEAVANHHAPHLVPASELASVLHVADAYAQHPGGDDPTLGGRLDVDFLETSCFASELPRWRLLAEQERISFAAEPRA